VLVYILEKPMDCKNKIGTKYELFLITAGLVGAVRHRCGSSASALVCASGLEKPRWGWKWRFESDGLVGEWAGVVAMGRK
jgi:hypothetical protein